MQNINLTPILQALIGLLATLITYRLIPWIKARTTNEQQIRLRAAVKVAVFAAEQLFGAGRGPEKMDYALSWLREQGFEIDSREIEAAVAEYLNLVVEYVEETEESKSTQEIPFSEEPLDPEQYFESGTE